MIGPREAFAMAERHAWWCRVTFDASVEETHHELVRWRNRYGVALSNHALHVIANHVYAASTAPVACAA